jgi:hypothetical protein
LRSRCLAMSRSRAASKASMSLTIMRSLSSEHGRVSHATGMTPTSVWRSVRRSGGWAGQEAALYDASTPCPVRAWRTRGRATAGLDGGGIRQQLQLRPHSSLTTAAREA